MLNLLIKNNESSGKAKYVDGRYQNSTHKPT